MTSFRTTYSIILAFSVFQKKNIGWIIVKTFAPKFFGDTLKG